jgi:uncharacterized repeat protein (TIGR01451 family)
MNPAIRIATHVLSIAVAAGLATGAIAATEPRQGHVTTITLSPASPVVPGTNVIITVNGAAPCGAIEINFGDGVDQVFPVSTMPFALAHTYPNAGTFTITAKGQGNCSGQTTAPLIVQPPSANTDLTVSLQVASPAVTGKSDPVSVIVHNGPVAVSGVAVRVTFSTGWTIAASPGAGCVQQAFGQVLCTTGSLAPNATQTFRIDAAAPANPLVARRGSAPDASVSAVVDPANQIAETNENNNTATADVSLERRADLAADGSSLPTTGSVGGDLTYPVRVKNLGDADAGNVAVRFFLSKQVDFVRVDGTQLTNCVVSFPVPNLPIVNCTASSVPAGGLVTANVVTHVITGLVNGDRIDFKMQVDPSNAIPDRDTTNNIASVTTTLSAAVDLAITSVTVERHAAASPPGSNSDFALACNADLLAKSSDANTIVHVQIKNIGPGQTTSAVVTVTWIAGVFPPQAGDCSTGTHCSNRLCVAGPPPANPAINFDHAAIPAMLPGSTVEIVFFASRTSDAAVLGTVTIDPTHSINDPNRANNVAQIK